MKRLLITALFIICSFVSIARADISDEKRQEIEKLLRLTGMEKLMGQMKSQMITGMKKQMPDSPDAFWTKLDQKMDIREMIEKIIPVYDKYYTLEDLKSANAFYESPAGKRILSATPMVT